MALAKTGRYYTGISPTPSQRVRRHNTGKGSKFAFEQGPLKLVYVSPPFANRSEARKYEVKIKAWSQTKKEKLISGEWSLL